MKLVIGGANQGKREYAKERYGESENFIADFHLTVLDLVKRGVDPVEYISGRMAEYADKVIICDDIFCGIVPEDPLARKWRESLGRALAIIAKESDEVIRVFCGLGMKIK